MKNEITLHLRRYPVLLQAASGGTRGDYITLSKDQLQAAQVCGLDDKALIQRMVHRQGFRVLDIDHPRKFSVTLDLDRLSELHEEESD